MERTEDLIKAFKSVNIGPAGQDIFVRLDASLVAKWLRCPEH